MSGADVVATGLGATTPLGDDVATTWQGLLDGRGGVSTITADWPTGYDLPVSIAAQLAVEPAGKLKYSELKWLDRCEQLAMIAAREAWSDAGLGAGAVDPRRLAVVIGTGIGCVHTLLSQHEALKSGYRSVMPQFIPMVMPNGPAAHVGLELGARAGVHAPMSACASGAEALAWAAHLIRSDIADVVVAGGAESCISPVIMAGFARAGAMCTRNDDPASASRPFDIYRSGFVLGEGAGVMILERADFAVARGARVYGRLAGVGVNNDAHHITAPTPDSSGQIDAVDRALRDAGLTATDIGHVSAHATSTRIGDAIEAATIMRAIGDHAVVTAPKGALGHLLGASGAVEAIATVLSVRHGLVPPTLNLHRVDPAVPLDVVSGKPREIVLDAAVTQSFGFGGHNIVLVFTS